MIRQEIIRLIEKSINELQKEKVFPKFVIPEVRVEHPEEKIYGDYSTNIAMIVAKEVKKNPLEIAELLKEKFPVLGPNFQETFERIKVAKPGFVNFFLSKGYLQKQIGKILKEGEKFGNLKIGRNKKVQVEFVSANPTGPLTVGNARGGPFGDTLANLLKKAGFKVEKAYYINDYGMQILTLGHSVLKDSQAKYKGEYIDYLNKKIKEKDPYRAGQIAAKIIIEEMIKKTVKKMGVSYDEWFSESELYKTNEVDKVLNFLKGKKLLYKKEGALWFKSSEYGDKRDRVIVKADDWKTYLAGDIAYHRYKFEKKKFDKVIDVWGADHAGDVPGLQAAVEALGYKGQLDIILLQFVTIFEKKGKVKMSKRAGSYFTMDDLLREVGSDVVRFFFLQKSADTHLNFNLSLAKKQSEKNPVYYVQYAHARICSIFKKAKSFRLPATRRQQAPDFKLLDHPSELDLIKQLIMFPEIIEDTARDYQIQRLPQYALDSAASFHRFYRDCKVLSENRSLREARVSLIEMSKIVLKNTLNLMGITAPEKM